MTIQEKLIPKFLRKYVFYYKEHGFKKTIKKFGWRLFAILFLYYLIMDYLIIFHRRRIKINFKAKNPYLKRIINAHYVHHKVHTKGGAKAFGFLFAPKEYDIKND